MKEACEQIVDLCAENAEITLFDFIGSSFKGFNQSQHYAINDGSYIEINKDSILNTKNQIK